MPAITDLAPEFLTTTRDGKTWATIETTQERLTTESFDFDAFDNRGRRFGARVYFAKETRTPVARNGASGLISNWVGSKFRVCGQALRAGESFGASQRYHYFDTLAEAEEWADAYVAAAEKRALKNKARAR